MKGSFEATVVLYAVGVACAFAVAAARRRPRSGLLLAALALVELTAVVQAVIDVVDLAGGPPSGDLATHIGYLVASVAVLPAAVAAVRLDGGRWGSVALAVGCVVFAAVSIRLHQTLGPSGRA